MGNSYDLQKEIEIKLDLGSFTNYLKLLGYLGQIDSELKQTNCFFDTEDHQISKEGWALRVRLEPERGLVTVKSKTISNDKAAVREELEAEISCADAENVINLNNDILSLNIKPIEFVKEKWNPSALSKLVHFENNRQCKEFKIGDHLCIFEIDSTSFSDGSVDYELEIELKNESEIVTIYDNLKKLFTSLHIHFENQSASKFARALKRARIF